jgi:hypothetical protein
MAAIPAQIYTAAVTAPPEHRLRHTPLSSMRNRAPETTSGSRWRFNRSTVNLHETDRAASVVSTSTRAPKLERAPSKMSLFNLFSRPKVEKARGHTEVGIAVPMRPQTPPKTPQPVSAPKSSLRQTPSPPAQQTLRARSSQIFRHSMRPITPSLNEFGSWDPPPLFQAFPQSLKHATVQACIFPPEVLMRSQSQRRHAELLRERMDSARDLSTIAENSTDVKKLEKSHRRLVSNSVLNSPAPELVNKIYILVTAGYVLQYAGDGTFDRLPERVLKLGKESAAFACDLIPGKHWVLQISSHAHDDGRVESGPKNTLLSRLRSQNAAVKQAATSFLLVLESAEEMDAWMTVVRKEIDTLGGMRAKDEFVRSSSSTEEAAEKKSTDTVSHRYLVQRDPNIISKVVPVDSPHRSQHSDSPKIVTSDWETNRSERTVSVADSSSGQSSRWGNSRQSTEMSSVASTPISQHQIQLDTLRGRSRFSFMSTATSTSGVATQNTSRESSPAPQSPLREDFLPNVDAEPLRSAMSLKSFHMNPTTGSASRRRSMQPLPITNEDFPPVIKTPVKKQRHSLYSPTSPTVPELGKPLPVDPPRPVKDSASLPNVTAADKITPHIVSATRSTAAQKSDDSGVHQSVPSFEQVREDSPVRSNVRNFSAPPRRGTISPPPREPAPLPPPSVRRQSTLETLPASTNAIRLNSTSVAEARSQRRLSSTPKPFLRPFPVRPQAQHGDDTMVIPRRQSSLTPTSAPAPLPFGINVNRSVTAPVRPTSVTANHTSNSSPNPAQSSQALRRPTSVQIRSDPAPFLSSSRPVRAISSTPSFVPGRRASNTPTIAPRVNGNLHSTPSIDTVRQQALAQHSDYKAVAPRRSMPAIGLPPPAPPPNMALPPLPPNMLSATPPPNMPLPSLPPSMSQPPPPPSIPLPAPPPNMPLPPVPTTSRTNGVSL